MTARVTAIAAAALLVLSGCGSGGGGEVAGEGGGGEGTAYQAAFELCKAGVQTLAAQYGVAPNEKEVANAIVDVAAPSPDDAPDARRGCHDALEKAEK